MKIMAEGREKRERKAPVATYTVVSPVKKEFVIPEGKGVKLRDIPNGECSRRTSIAPFISRRRRECAQLPTHPLSNFQINACQVPCRSFVFFVPSLRARPVSTRLDVIAAEHPILLTPGRPSPGMVRAVDFNLNKIRSDDEILKLIHRMMYRTPGKQTVIKKNIREFSGLVYDDEEKDRAKTEELISRAFGSTMNQILDILDLPRGSGPEGVKEAKVERLVKFLEKPAPTDGKKNMKEAAEAKKEKAAAKREKAAAKKEKAAAKREKAAAKKAKASGSRSSAKLPSEAAAIKKELEKLNKTQAALLKKLEKAVSAGGTKRKVGLW